MQANSSCNTREAEASQNMADGTLSLNSRELKDSEVIDITELPPEGHGISQDVEDILEANHISPSVVDDEGPEHLCHPCLRTKSRVVLRHHQRTA
jgi:hypothetical protein